MVTLVVLMFTGQWREGEPAGARGGDAGRKPTRNESVPGLGQGM